MLPVTDVFALVETAAAAVAVGEPALVVSAADRDVELAEAVDVWDFEPPQPHASRTTTAPSANARTARSLRLASRRQPEVTAAVVCT